LGVNRIKPSTGYLHSFCDYGILFLKEVVARPEKTLEIDSLIVDERYTPLAHPPDAGRVIREGAGQRWSGDERMNEDLGE
jgi:hypothetical protein